MLSLGLEQPAAARHTPDNIGCPRYTMHLMQHVLPQRVMICLCTGTCAEADQGTSGDTDQLS